MDSTKLKACLFDSLAYWNRKKPLLSARAKQLAREFDFRAPESWTGMTDRQLKYVYSLIAAEMDINEIKVRSLLAFSGVRLNGVIGPNKLVPYRVYHLRRNGQSVGVPALAIAELLPALDWLGEIPERPVLQGKMRGRWGLKRYEHVSPDLNGVPFSAFLTIENLYQGYLATRDDSLLDSMAHVMYPGLKGSLAAPDRVSMFYWAAALKAMMSKEYPDLFRPATEETTGNLLGVRPPSAKESMNAQIRALTKGDITKEKLILDMDTHRALTELNAQAREYNELNTRMK